MKDSKHILQRNDGQIEKDKAKLETAKGKFVPFLNELQATGFEFDTVNFQNLAFGESEKLLTWIKEKTLQASPEVNNLPIKHDKKIEMIDIGECSALLDAHNEIHADTKYASRSNQLRKEVFSFDLQNGELVISEDAEQKIIDSHTIYGNDDAKEMLKVCESIKKQCEQAKINPLRHPALIRVNADGEISINVEGINQSLQDFEKNKDLQNEKRTHKQPQRTA